MSAAAFVHPTADVEIGATVGDATKVWAHSHIRAGAQIGRECTVGEKVYIDVRVWVGDRAKIQNQAAIFGPARIGHGAFIGPGACLTNDLRPRAVNPDGSPKTDADWEARGVTVGDGASVGAMATVLSGVSVGNWAVVGAGSVLTRDLRPHEIAVGVPARVVGHACRCGLRLPRDLRCSCGRAYELTENVLEIRQR